MQTSKNSYEQGQQPFGLLPVVIGVCGFSGSGKTTLIESVLPSLKSSGLAVAVLKHDVHGLVMDRPGKDTNRFVCAGADFVFAHSTTKSFQIYSTSMSLEDALRALPLCLDLIIVEGHKNSPLRRVWLDGPKSDNEPAGLGSIARLPWNVTGRAEQFFEIIKSELKKSIDARPLRYGLMAGGKSTRMGSPKALLEVDGEFLAERTFRILNSAACSNKAATEYKPVILGAGPLPGSLINQTTLLPDPPCTAGPVAGLLAASRWAPDSAWMICALDMPGITPETIDWIISMRKPGAWAVLPKLPNSPGVEPLSACYEPMIFPYIESMVQKGRMALNELARHPKVITPLVPERFVPAFTNVNRPQDWKNAVGSSNK